MAGVGGGVMTSLLAGVVNGSFATPTKYTSRWRWENIWAIWAVAALMVVPWAAAFATVPGLVGFYRETSSRQLMVLTGLGLGVGFSQIFFGLALAEVGLSITFAVAIGLSTAIGSALPLLMLDLSTLTTRGGGMILAGISFMLVGTAACGVAGSRRDKERNVSPSVGTTRKRISRGLVLCILAGVLSPLENVALAYGAPLIKRAAELGVEPASRTNVIWPLVLTATMVPYLAYCFFLWRKNKSWRLFAAPKTGHYWLLGFLMGILWTGSVILYGYSSTLLGRLGPALGWPLFMSVIIVTSNVWGILTREWKGVTRRAFGTMLAGIFSLVLGFCAVAVAST